MDADELISILLDDDRIKKGRLFEEKIYRDEPILQTASKLAKAQIPEKLKEMRQLAYTPEAVWKTDEWLFCKQGKLMENFDDDFSYVDIRSISRPFYKQLTNEELRGFFTWRGRIRRGEEAEECDTYIYLYAFELINLIGADSPQDAFEKLMRLYEQFSDGRTGSRLSELLCDLAVFYQLPRDMCSGLPGCEFDNALIALIKYDSTDDKQLFSAVKRLSDYKIESSQCYKKHPDEFAEYICCAVRSLSEHYKTSRPFHIQLFGMMLSRWYIPFRSGIFFNREDPLRSFEYELNEVRRYICTKGIWQLQSYLSTRSKRLGAVVKTTDCILRRQLGMKSPLKKGELSREDEEVLTAALDNLTEERRKASLPKIEIDLSKLGEIRRVSEITRDKLVVEEDEEPIEITAAEVSAEKENTHLAESTDTLQETPLSDIEAAFLRALLYNGDFRAAAAGSMPSLLADSINEKLFDDFGDTVIDFDGDDPFVIEDYEEELKGKIPE